jgi:pimeloyl-ACP methyl ester carboxylesterase
MKQDAHELRTLLKNAGVKPPYILVGHSVGGLILRVYAEQYPDDVAGAVLMDSTHEDGTLMYKGKLARVREMATARPVPAIQTIASSPPKLPTAQDLEEAARIQKLFGPPKTEPPFDKLPPDVQRMRLWVQSNPKLSAEVDDFWAEELQAMHAAREKSPCPLGDTPLVVLVGSRKDSSLPPPGVSAEEWQRLSDEKRRQKVGLTTLSRNSKLVLAEKSGHHIQLDEPGLVIDAIRQVLEVARRGTRLPATEPRDK